VLCAVAFRELHRELGGHGWHDVLRHLGEIPPAHLAAALAFTACGYLALTAYDTLGVHWVGARVPYRRIALASFVAYVFSHNLGAAVLSGSAVRFRLYPSWGVAPADVGRIIAFAVLTFWIGLLVLAGVLCPVLPLPLPADWHLPIATSRPLGIAAIAVLVVYGVLLVRRRTPLRLHGFEIALPDARFTALQVVIGVADWTFASAVLWAVLPSGSAVSLAWVIQVFLLAQTLGLASTIPGGVGVFETVVVVLLAPALPAPAVLGSLVAFRIVYYLVPFLLGVLLFAGYELVRRPVAVAGVGRVLRAGAPSLLALATFAAGALVLWSSATSPQAERLWRLPLPLIEASHLAAGVVGMLLLVLSRAVYRRVDAAWAALVVLLVSGILVCLGKGLDWEEAVALAVVLAVVLPARRAFDRRALLFAGTFSRDWLQAVVVVLLGTGFLIAIAHRDVAFSAGALSTVAHETAGPRSLRALAAAAVTLVVLGVVRLLRPAPPSPALPDAAALERAAAIVATAPRSDAHLALAGDKQLLFDDEGAGFVMYAVREGTWVSMGDPVGPPVVRERLAWQFRELVERHGGRTVFYEVDADALPVYLEMGLGLRKLGEEARVRLADFSLEGGTRARLRQAIRHVERDGGSFEVVAPAAVPPLLDELEAVSQTWLRDKQTREKRFSLGFFDRAYLARCPLAVVRRDGRVVAFANVWAGHGEEMGLDLMRHATDGPGSTMDYLFIQLMLWGKEQGYRWFSLGMAPLAGLASHPLAPAWSRLGAALFRHGEHFYNFQGLRGFKQKFAPEWRPRYLAGPRGVALPLVLVHVAAIVSGGVRGVVAK
jgi:phosphatidylglycerol lysyltransferase